MTDESRTGYVIAVVALVVAAAIYFLPKFSLGPKNPNGGSGAGSGNNPAGGSSSGGCGSTLCLGTSSDGSSDAVSVSPQSQTEAAYNVDPTDMSDAFGSDANTGGDDLVYA
jgi:hypothetical protein